MLNFDFLKKSLGIVSPPHSVFGFSIKMFLKLYSINPYYPNFEFFHKKLRFGVFLSVDNYFTFKNSKKYVLMVPGPKY